MAGKSDYADMSIEQLTAILAEVTEALDTKKAARRAELIAELEALGGAAAATRKPRTPNSEGATRNSPAVKYRGPNGEEYSGRGAMPRWAKQLGITDKAGLTPYLVRPETSTAG